MNLIFGGAYQGKLEYAKKTYGIREDGIFTCDSNTVFVDFTKNVIYNTEEFVLACVREGIEAREFFQKQMPKDSKVLIICEDISQGIVPMEAEKRAWREMVGRLLTYLAEEAEEVTRVFCGLPQRLK